MRTTELISFIPSNIHRPGDEPRFPTASKTLRKSLAEFPTFHDVSAHGGSGELHDFGVKGGGSAKDGFDAAAEQLMDLLEGQLIPHGIVAENARRNLFLLFTQRQVEQEFLHWRLLGAGLKGEKPRKIQLNPAIAHLKGPPIFIRYSGVTLLPGLNLTMVH